MSIFLSQSKMSALGKYAETIRDLPDDISSMVNVVRGLFIHCSYADVYGIDASTLPVVSRETLSVEKRLDQIFHGDQLALTDSLPIEKREIVTCRDYALMICGLLREKNIPSRIRCGFATYFSPNQYEDHWICEYFCSGKKKWVRVDAQLDDRLCQHLGISFNTVDLPDNVFFSAEEAWSLTRNGKADAKHFGHGDAVGEWFLWLNLARDFLALTGQEISNWDGWRVVKGQDTLFSDVEFALCDTIAKQIDELKNERAVEKDALNKNMRPFWFYIPEMDDPVAILEHEFVCYYHTDMLPHNYFENEVIEYLTTHTAGRFRLISCIPELLVLLRQMLDNRLHPMNIELANLTDLEWHIEDSEWLFLRKVLRGIIEKVSAR